MTQQEIIFNRKQHCTTHRHRLVTRYVAGFWICEECVGDQAVIRCMHKAMDPWKGTELGRLKPKWLTLPWLERVDAIWYRIVDGNRIISSFIRHREWSMIWGEGGILERRQRRYQIIKVTNRPMRRRVDVTVRRFYGPRASA